MERLFKMIEALLPVFAFYPRWFQVLLILALCLIAVLFISGVVLFSEASRENAIHETASKINVNISVMQNENDKWKRKSDTKLEYIVDRIKEKTVISPSMEYLSKLRTGGPIQPINYTSVPFEWDFPSLDIKIVNNSDKTLFLNEAVLNVIESHLDPSPVLVIQSGLFLSHALHFTISNEGWGVAKEARVDFHLIPLTNNTHPNYLSPYPYSVSLGDIDEESDVDLTNSFVQAGVNLEVTGTSFRDGHRKVIVVDANGHKTTLSEQEFLSKQQSSLGKFPNGGAIVSGEILYQSQLSAENNHHHSVKFSTTVWIFSKFPIFILTQPSFEYGTRLEVEGTNYTRRVNISHEIKPGATDRFVIKVGVDKSSIHKLSLQLVSNGSQIINAGEIELGIFVPRSGTKYIVRENTLPESLPVPLDK